MAGAGRNILDRGAGENARERLIAEQRSEARGAGQCHESGDGGFGRIDRLGAAEPRRQRDGEGIIAGRQAWASRMACLSASEKPNR